MINTGLGLVNDKREIVIGNGARYLPDATAPYVKVAGGKIMPAAFNNNGIVVDSDGGVWNVQSGIKISAKPAAIGYGYVANDLNDNNQILYSTVSKNDSYFYGLDGKQIHLNFYGWDLDNLGNVVGNSKDANGARAKIWISDANAGFDLSAYLNVGL